MGAGLKTYAIDTAKNAATGLIGGLVSRVFAGADDRRQLRQQGKLQELEIQGQKQMMDYSQQKQLEMWEATGYGAQKKQMESAGLNPGLLYGMGGGGGQTVGNTNGNVTGGHAPSGSALGMDIQGQMMQLQLLRAQKENIEADTANKQAQTAFTSGAQTGLAEATKNSLTQGIQNQKAQETLTRVQTEIAQVEASVARQTIKDAMQTIENTAKKGIEEIQALKLQNALSEEQFNDKIELLKAEVATIAVKNALMNAQKENINQDTKNKIQEILESQSRIKAMAHHVTIAWRNMQVNEREAELKLQQSIEIEGLKELGEIMPGMILPIGKGMGGSTPVKGFHQR